MHKIHKDCFSHSWDSTTFRKFLDDPHIFGFGASIQGKKNVLAGFILVRLVCGEAEILTFAVLPTYRRLGAGRALLEHLLRFLYGKRAEILFLEVEETNKPALALYHDLGFKKTGRRKGYYEGAVVKSNKTGEISPINISGKHKRSDALLFERRLRQPLSRNAPAEQKLNPEKL